MGLEPHASDGKFTPTKRVQSKAVSTYVFGCMNGNHLRIREHAKVASTMEIKFSEMANWML